MINRSKDWQAVAEECSHIAGQIRNFLEGRSPHPPEIGVLLGRLRLLEARLTRLELEGER